MKKSLKGFLPAVVGSRVYVECQVCKGKIDVNHWARPDSGFKDPKGADRHFSRHCIDCDTNYDIYAKSATEFLVKVAPTVEWRGLLLVKHHTASTYLVVEIEFYLRDGVVNTDMEYYINEHTCPTNWLDVIAVADNGDIDPHGVFEFCRAMTYQQIQEKYAITRGVLRQGDQQDEALLVVFPELGEEMSNAADSRPDGVIVH